MIQDGGNGIRGPQTVVSGGVIEIEVAPNDTQIEVSEVGGGPAQKHPVPPGKKALIPAPTVSSSTMLYISIGDGSRNRVILVEVILQD